MQRSSLLSLGLLCVLIGPLAIAGNGGSGETGEPFEQGTGEVGTPNMAPSDHEVAGLLLARRIQRKRSTRGRSVVYSRRSQLPRSKRARRQRNNNNRGQGSRKQGGPR